MLFEFYNVIFFDTFKTCSKLPYICITMSARDLYYAPIDKKCIFTYIAMDSTLVKEL
jgi:hypothetical protein